MFLTRARSTAQRILWRSPAPVGETLVASGPGLLALSITALLLHRNVLLTPRHAAAASVLGGFIAASICIVVSASVSSRAAGVRRPNGSLPMSWRARHTVVEFVALAGLAAAAASVTTLTTFAVSGGQPRSVYAWAIFGNFEPTQLEIILGSVGGLLTLLLAFAWAPLRADGFAFGFGAMSIALINLLEPTIHIWRNTLLGWTVWGLILISFGAVAHAVRRRRPIAEPRRPTRSGDI